MSIVFASEYTTKNYWNKRKNISIKMLKDVGMTVPKSRETSAVYMQQFTALISCFAHVYSLILPWAISFVN